MIDILRTALLCFAIVMAAMILLTAGCAALKRVGIAAGRADASTGEGVAAIDPRVMVVISAAVAEALGPRVRIHHVHVHRGGVIDRWSRAGRMDVMVSHRVGPTR